MKLASVIARLVVCLLAASAVVRPSLAAMAPQTKVDVDGPVDIDELLQVVRIRASMSANTYYKYTFRQAVTEEDLASDGRVKRSETSVYQVIPSREGTERHLISHDGQEPSKSELKKQEKRNERLKDHFAKIRARQEKAQERAQPAPAQQPAPAPRATPAPPRPTPSPDTVSPVPVQAPPPALGPAPVAGPAPTPPPAQASAPPPITAAPEAVAPRPALPPVLPSGEPLPPCDMANIIGSLRPPLPGSVVQSRRTPPTTSLASRKGRDNASDYSLLELLALTDYEYAGACAVAARPMHVVRFSPPKTFDPANPVERVMTAMSGTLLVDGLDLQVARAEGRTVAPIAWGAGLVKLRSAHVLLEFSKVRDEIWLPARDVFDFDSRVIFDNEINRVTQVFDDFQKATVDIETEYDYKP